MSLVAFPGEHARLSDAEADVDGSAEMPMIMSSKVMAEILEVSIKTLERWRIARERDGKTGPAWHKIPGSSVIRYSRTDVDTVARAHLSPLN